MNGIRDFIKGMLIGIANIIPGVSGGTMAVSMGIYDKLIHSLTNLKKEFKESIRFLLPILLGAGAAIVALSFVITFLLKEYPLETNFAFIGLIVGGLPAICKNIKNTKGKKISVANILALLIFFGIVVGMALMGDAKSAAADISFSFSNVLILFGVGIIAAATMVIPGVSGSMILMLLGYYEPVISSIKEFIQSLVHMDGQGILTGCGILIPFGLGAVFGIFAIAKIIEIIFTKWPLVAYFAIIGLIIASPIAIMLLSAVTTIGVMNVIISIITFIAGTLVAYKLGGE